MTLQETMTVKEIADLFGNSVTTIYNWRDKGMIKPIRSSPRGKGELYAKEDIMKLYKSCLKEG